MMASWQQNTTNEWRRSWRKRVFLEPWSPMLLGTRHPPPPHIYPQVPVQKCVCPILSISCTGCIESQGGVHHLLVKMDLSNPYNEI